MKFSVIVPVYNVEAYLSECLDSIVNQTCQDFEIILIDDGSTDNSGRICDSYARQFPEQIKVFHQKNQGLLKTRVGNLDSANGEIILFVDSDDALRLDALEVINDTFDKTGCEMVIYGASRDRRFLSGACLCGLENEHCFEGAGKRELYALIVNTGKLNSMCIKATKKEVYDRFLRDYNTDVEISNGEDLYLTIPLVTCADKIVYLQEKLYFYRIREGSMVNSFSLSLHKSVKLVRMEMEKYLDIWGIQAYYPAFYAHVVSLWIYALKSLLKNQSVLDQAEATAILREMSEDTFFRRAYEKTQPGCLCRMDRILARWLYRGKFLLLRLTGRGFALLKKRKEKLCRTLAK